MVGGRPPRVVVRVRFKAKAIDPTAESRLGRWVRAAGFIAMALVFGLAIHGAISLALLLISST